MPKERISNDIYNFRDFCKGKIFQEQIAEATFFFNDAEPLLDFPRPVLRKVVDVGGINVPEVQPLNEAR